MSEIRYDNLGPDDYERAKTVLNKAKHPGFVGRELFYRCATTGVVCIAVVDDVDCGVAMVAKEKLQALSVVVAAQGRGVGQALISRLKPKWVNAIGERIGFFEKLGYKQVGAPRVGQNGKHSTQLLQRDDSSEVADHEIKDRATTAPATELAPVQSLRELVDESIPARIEAELEILDRLLVQAVAAERYDSALKIIEGANELMAHRDRHARVRNR